MQRDLAPEVIVTGRDEQPILCLDDWFRYAPPAGGCDQWVDGYSAKEQAKAWMRSGSPGVPAEILEALWNVGVEDLESVTAYPEYETPLDKFARGGKANRNHDVLAVGRRTSGETVVIGIEAKACERFDGIVGTRASAPAPSKKSPRANLLSRALFDRDVCDVNTGTVIDADLAAHGYQLWTAAVGTLIEAAKHEATLAVLLVHQFEPDPVRGPDARDRRGWGAALKSNERALSTFVAALAATGEAISHPTEFVRGGIVLRVAKARAPLAPPIGTADC